MLIDCSAERRLIRRWYPLFTLDFDIVIKKNENNTAAPVDHVDEIVRMVS
jgi:hypothetical protein